MRNVRDMINLLVANEEIGLDAIIEAIVTVRNNADTVTFNNLNKVLKLNGITLKASLNNHNLDNFVLDIIDDIFMERYIVPGFHLPRHIGVEKEEETAFREYIMELACKGVFNDEIAVHVRNFHKEIKQ